MGSELIVEVFALPCRGPTAALRQWLAERESPTAVANERLAARLLHRCTPEERQEIVALYGWLREDLQQQASPATLLRLALTAVCKEVENPRSRILVAAGITIAGQDLYVAGGTGDADPEPLVVQVLLLKTLGIIPPLHDPGLEVYRRLHRCTVEAPADGHEHVVHRGHPQYEADAEDEWDGDTLSEVAELLQPYYGDEADVKQPTMQPPTLPLPQVAIRVEGGVAEVIAADHPVEVLFVDYDVEGAEATQQYEGTPCSIWTDEPPLEPETMNKLRIAAQPTNHA